jgi:uroporphyrinogen-III decarboxylase
VAFREKYPQIVIMGASMFVNGELENGKPGDVMERARQNIERLGPFGRLVLSPVCCMPWRIPLANVLALREAVETYGRYPMQGPATDA